MLGELRQMALDRASTYGKFDPSFLPAGLDQGGPGTLTIQRQLMDYAWDQGRSAGQIYDPNAGWKPDARVTADMAGNAASLIPSGVTLKANGAPFMAPSAAAPAIAALDNLAPKAAAAPAAGGGAPSSQATAPTAAVAPAAAPAPAAAAAPATGAPPNPAPAAAPTLDPLTAMAADIRNVRYNPGVDDQWGGSLHRVVNNQLAPMWKAAGYSDKDIATIYRALGFTDDQKPGSTTKTPTATLQKTDAELELESMSPGNPYRPKMQYYASNGLAVPQSVSDASAKWEQEIGIHRMDNEADAQLQTQLHTLDNEAAAERARISADARTAARTDADGHKRIPKAEEIEGYLSKLKQDVEGYANPAVDALADITKRYASVLQTNLGKEGYAKLKAYVGSLKKGQRGKNYAQLRQAWTNKTGLDPKTGQPRPMPGLIGRRLATWGWIK
jgi:hypothetical protein